MRNKKYSFLPIVERKIPSHIAHIVKTQTNAETNALLKIAILLTHN